MSFKFFISLALFSLPLLHPETCFADQDSRLFGRWASYKFVGSPCSDLIASIQYSFHPGGHYEIDSRMKRFGGTKDEKASGSYEIRQGHIVGQVDGHKVGPFRYRFEGRDLVINNGSPACEIFLKQEEEF